MTHFLLRLTAKGPGRLALFAGFLSCWLATALPGTAQRNALVTPGSPARHTRTTGATPTTASRTTTAPANDLCTAANLPVLTCGGTLTGTTVGSTSTGDPTSSCSNISIFPAGGGVFYRFVGTGQTVSISTCSSTSGFDTQLFVYTGTCGALVCQTANDQDCGDYSTVTFPSVNGTSYLIFVNGYNGTQGTFTLTATCLSTPTITSFTPSTGVSGTNVTITGTGFTGAYDVSFNGYSATFTVNSATSITATVPSYATTGPITVTNAAGTATSSRSFTITPPTLTSFTPTIGAAGTNVTITGTGFTGAYYVYFNGESANFTVNSATSITATVPYYATTGPISVITPGGTATSTNSFTVPVPTITGFSPTSGAAGATVTITGTNFTGAYAVDFNGVSTSFTVNSAASITAIVPNYATTGPISVLSGGGTAISSNSFTVLQPTITGFTPTSGPPGTSVTITGTNLGNALYVEFNGSAANITANTATSITATVPNFATSGPIRVTTGGGVATSSNSFTVLALPAPSNDLCSTSVPLLTCGGSVTGTILGATATNDPTGTCVYSIDGVGVFYRLIGNGQSVTLSTCGATTDFDTKLHVFSGTCGNLACVVGDDDSDCGTTSLVTFTAASGTTYYIFVSGYNGAQGNFTLSATCQSAATITGFSPTSGTVGTNVTITGTNFTGATNVTFNGQPAAFTVNSATSITATVPYYATTGTISVTGSAGTATSSTAFTVLAPTVTSFTPTSGQIGTTVTITGANLTGVSGVSFNGATASFTVNSATSITATVPAGASTGTISVTSAAGTGTSSGVFTVQAPTNDLCSVSAPLLACGGSVTGTTLGATATGDPTAGCGTSISGGGVFYRFTGNGQAVTLSTCGGTTNYDSKLHVFSGTCGNLTCVTGNDDACSGYASSVTFVAASGTTYYIFVSGYNGAQGNFTLTATCFAPPTITSFTPTSGLSGANVTITGTGFTSATNVAFNGTAASFTINSATSISTTVPLYATSGPISVTTTGGTATSAASFTVTAPPAPTNDLCAATNLPTLACGGTVTGTTLGATATGDPTAGCGTSINGGGVFYRFTGNGQAAIISTCGGTTNYDSKLHVFTGACGNLTCVAGNDDACGGYSSSVTFATTNGTSYLVFVSGYNGAQGNFTLTATCQPAPTITSFTPTTSTVGASVTITGTNFTGVTAVRFNGTAASFTVNSATSITATVPLYATTGPISVTTLAGTATSTGNFTVQAPTNDLCTATNLPVLTCGATITGTTLGATATGDPTVGCGTSIDGAGVFYRFTGNGQAVTLSTCGGTTNYDSKLHVFTGACGSLTCVAGNDDACGGLSSSVSFATTSGTSYLIFVSGYRGAQGNFTLTATCGPPTITSFTPTSGPAGTLVTVTGTNLIATQNAVFNTGASNYIGANTATSVLVSVPANATTGPITLTTGNGTTTSAGSFTVTPSTTAPTITTYSPTSGLPGTVITLIGTNFSGATGVLFNGVLVTSFTINSATSITVTVPAGALPGPISVIGPGGMGTTPTSFLVPPTVASFTPASAVIGATVKLTGSGYANVTDVKFNGVSATSFTINSVTGITATVPTGATTGPVTVTTGGGLGSSSTSFTVLVPPVVSAFTPTSGPSGTNVTITGTNFTGASTVLFNGTAAAFTLVNGTTITTKVPTGATTGVITVTTAGGTATSAGNFTVGGANAPTIASFTPTSGPVGTVVTVTGTNFTGATSVTLGGVSVSGFTVTNATTLTFTVPSNATSGVIGVTTPSGTATSATSFTIAPPTITSFAPSAGAIVGATVTLTGTNLTGATSVLFNGVPAASFNVVSATTVTAVVPPTATTGPISITTAGGTATSGTFKVLPTITSFTPTFGTPHAPATVVTITGTGLLGATIVKFSTGTATQFTVVNSTTITATVPANALTGKLSVTTAGGTATSTASFGVAPTVNTLFPSSGAPGSVVLLQGLNFTSAATVALNGTSATKTYNATSQLTATVPTGATSGPFTVTTVYGSHTSTGTYTVTSGTPPTITSFAPTQNVIRGTVVTITGTRFTGATIVRFNNINTTAITVLSDTQVRAAVPAGATSGKVYVVTPTGMAQSAASLTIVQPPTISSLSPTSGAVGSVVLIGGANYSGLTFPGVTSVKFNGVAATSFTINSATQIAAVVPAGATTGKVTVTSLAGTATSVGTFTVLAGPPPTITSLSPTQGLRGSTVVVTGTNFTGVTSVKLGAVALTAGTGYTINSATQMTLTVPSTAVTGKVYVTTSTGGMAQSPTDYTVLLTPTITSFSPTSGPVGTLVTINGTNYAGITSVKFGGVNATNYTVVSTAKITATVPTGAVTGAVTVTNAAGTATKSTYTVTTPPTITGFSPASGVRGATVTVTGTNFTGATAVKIGAVTATAFTVVSPTQLTFTVPTTALTGTVSVTTSQGTATSASTFTVILAPTITSFTPASAGAGTVVTITGTNFTGSTSVKFGTGAATSFTVVSATTITATVPSTATTGKVQVTNPAGTATSAGTFTRTSPRAADAAGTEALAPAMPLEVRLFPIPATAWVELEVTNLPAAEATAELVDGLGRLVRHYAVGEGLNRLELNGIPPGIYVVRISGQQRRLIVE